jgi:DNA-binding transcriptional MerR regulator
VKSGGVERDASQGVYAISVVTELTGIEPHTLRLYESRGLLTPARSEGGVRRYSDQDVQRLERISALAATGLNLTGVKRVLELEAENAQLRAEIKELQQRFS